MSFYFRKLSKCSYWDSSRKENVLLANCLRCLNTSGVENVLSIWLTDDTSLDLAIVQMVNRGGHLTDVHYAKVPKEAIEGLGIPLHQKDDKPLVTGRLKGSHHDLQVRTAERLLEVGNTLLTSADFGVRTKHQIATCILEAVNSNTIRNEDISEKLWQDVLSMTNEPL